MRYDLLYLLPASNDDAAVPPLKESVVGILTAANATIIREEDLGKRKLAYPIKGARYGHYLNILFEAESKALPQVQEKLRLNTDILRCQIVQEEQTAGKSPRPSARYRPVRKKTTEERVKEEIKETSKVSLEELDKKLEEILSEEVK